uniref:CUB domain-containing protein n=1 Tax=Romanomermis culicivorax TaxID=13658 RepID=A0A915IHN6_ROMCU
MHWINHFEDCSYAEEISPTIVILGVSESLYNLLLMCRAIGGAENFDFDKKNLKLLTNYWPFYSIITFILIKKWDVFCIEPYQMPTIYIDRLEGSVCKPHDFTKIRGLGGYIVSHDVGSLPAYKAGQQCFLIIEAPENYQIAVEAVQFDLGYSPDDKKCDGDSLFLFDNQPEDGKIFESNLDMLREYCKTLADVQSSSSPTTTPPAYTLATSSNNTITLYWHAADLSARRADSRGFRLKWYAMKRQQRRPDNVPGWSSCGSVKNDVCKLTVIPVRKLIFIIQCDPERDFVCSNGQTCIPLALACDAEPHCSDGSDMVKKRQRAAGCEKNCKKTFQEKAGYKESGSRDQNPDFRPDTAGHVTVNLTSVIPLTDADSGFLFVEDMSSGAIAAVSAVVVFGLLTFGLLARCCCPCCRTTRPSGADGSSFSRTCAPLCGAADHSPAASFKAQSSSSASTAAVNNKTSSPAHHQAVAGAAARNCYQPAPTAAAAPRFYPPTSRPALDGSLCGSIDADGSACDSTPAPPAAPPPSDFAVQEASLSRQCGFNGAPSPLTMQNLHNFNNCRQVHYDSSYYDPISIYHQHNHLNPKMPMNHHRRIIDFPDQQQQRYDYSTNVKDFV